jgi:hypothetical protein
MQIFLKGCDLMGIWEIIFGAALVLAILIMSSGTRRIVFLALFVLIVCFKLFGL